MPPLKKFTGCGRDKEHYRFPRKLANVEMNPDTSLNVEQP
jgi:hypothetical protein